MTEDEIEILFRETTPGKAFLTTPAEFELLYDDIDPPARVNPNLCKLMQIQVAWEHE